MWIKRDFFFHFYQGIFHALRRFSIRNWIFAGVGILGVVFFSIAYFHFKNKDSQAAQDAFYAATEVFQAELKSVPADSQKVNVEVQFAKTIAAFTNVAKQFSKTYPA